MHIGYDGKRAVQNNTGLGNYSRLLAAVMARRFGSDRFTLYAPRPRTTPRLAPVLEAANVELRGPEGALWRLVPALWRQWGGRCAPKGLTSYTASQVSSP